MEAEQRLVRVTTVFDSFHGRVVVARLAAEGVRADLSGATEGPYPLPGEVAVWVQAEDLDRAREILLGDEVDASFTESATQNKGHRKRVVHRGMWLRWLRMKGGR